MNIAEIPTKMLSADLLARFVAIVGEKNAITDGDAQAPYLTEPRDMFRGRSPVVLRPGSVAEVSAILKLASESATAIVPQGGNTGLVGGQIAQHGEIVLALGGDGLHRRALAASRARVFRPCQRARHRERDQLRADAAARRRAGAAPWRGLPRSAAATAPVVRASRALLAGALRLARGAGRNSRGRTGARARGRRHHRRKPRSDENVLAHPRNVRRGAAPRRWFDQARRLRAGGGGARLHCGGERRGRQAHPRRSAAAVRASRRRQHPLQRGAARRRGQDRVPRPLERDQRRGVRGGGQIRRLDLRRARHRRDEARSLAQGEGSCRLRSHVHAQARARSQGHPQSRQGALAAAPDARSYPERPYLAVSAAIVRDGKILVVRRARAPAHGLYSLPGGVVEVGETLEEAVTREVREETGMTIEPVALAGFREAIVRDAESRVERHFIILCFVARWRAREVLLNDELDEARWLDPAELADLPSTSGLAEIVAVAFQRLASHASM